MKENKLRKFIKEIVNTLEEVESSGDYYEAMQNSDGEWGVYEPSERSHTMKPVPLKKCKNRHEASQEAERMNKERMDEEHGDVHYWGAQPGDAQHKISTGYKSTVPLEENEHPSDHEAKEVRAFQAIKVCAERLIQLHSTPNYNEEQELALIRNIKKLAMAIETMHTGTKITTNEAGKK